MLIKNVNIIFILILIASSRLLLVGRTIEEIRIEQKCATYLPKIKKQKMEEMLKITELEMQKTYATKRGLFLIHYDTSGQNAVEQIDKNRNNIPDYVDSVAYYLEYIHSYYVDSIGYLSPIPDNGQFGSNAYDVFLLDLGNGSDTYYGYTQPTDEVLPRKKVNRFYSYLVLDNNYSPYDSTDIFEVKGEKKIQTYIETGIEGMKLTAAHEYHHAIQLMYGEVDYPATASLNEMTSTFMEWRIFPNTKDYIRFVGYLFEHLENYPFGSGSADVGYGFSIFGQYCYYYYGDFIFKRMWELISDGVLGYAGLDSAFREKGTNLSSEFCSFLEWLYYTGNRAIENKYFVQAKWMPELQFRSEIYSKPSIITNDYLKSYQVVPRQYIFLADDKFSTNDTFNIVMTNLDLESAINQTLNKQKSVSVCITETQEPSSILIEGTRYYYTFQADLDYICRKSFLITSHPTHIIGYAYPDPLNINKHQSIHFPVPNSTPLFEKAILTIYSTEMETIYQGRHEVTSDRNNRVVRLTHFPEQLGSGIYIFKVQYLDKEINGKFAVVK